MPPVASDALHHESPRMDSPIAQASDSTSRPEESPPSVFSLELAELDSSAPIRWLKLGWADFARCPRIGLFYGLCFFLMGHALMAVFKSAPEYVLWLSAGFLLMGPFLCLGLYDASKAMQTNDHRPSLRASLMSWRPTKGTMGIFAFVLLILEMLWGRAALIVFAVSFNNMPGTVDVMDIVFNPENIGFVVTYLIVGGIFATLIFVTSAISIPMIMDRQTDAISAGLTSIRACLKNPGVMLQWGAMITFIIAVAMAPAFVGLFIAGPVIGHATWHAYREIVPAQDTAIQEGSPSA